MLNFSIIGSRFFVAIVLGILTATTQYLKYKNTDRKYFGRKILLPTIISLLIAVSISVFGNIDYNTYGAGFLAAIHLAIFASVYGVVANTGYIWLGLNGKLKAAGAQLDIFQKRYSADSLHQKLELSQS